ncbi:MAG: 4a-hydroxytetrahydrobiopterin dehydratase [Fimbriimonadaceae bacterium]
MELSYEKLSEDQVNEAVQSLDGWNVDSGMLAKEFHFDSYEKGVLFANAVAFTAEALNHHPDIMIGYSKVRVATVTHDAGGLTSYDVELASRIQGLA